MVNQIYAMESSRLFPKAVVESWMNDAKELHFSKGTPIMEGDDANRKVYLIRQGTVRAFQLHEMGKECIVGMMSDGDFLNLFDGFTDKESTMFFSAQTDVTLLAISREEIRQTVEQNPDLALSLLSMAANRLHDMVEILSQVAYGKVEERLIYLFQKFADRKFEGEDWLPLTCSVTHQDIAGMVGSTRETVTVLMNKLTHAGRIKQESNQIWIHSDEVDMQDQSL